MRIETFPTLSGILFHHRSSPGPLDNLCLNWNSLIMSRGALVLTFFLTSGSTTLWLFKWLHRGASLPFNFHFGAWTRGQALAVLQAHAPCNVLSPFGTQGLGVTGWGLWLAASAPWFALIGHFRVHLGGSGGGHDRRWAYHGLRLRFRADREKKKRKRSSALLIR